VYEDGGLSKLRAMTSLTDDWRPVELQKSMLEMTLNDDTHSTRVKVWNPVHHRVVKW